MRETTLKTESLIVAPKFLFRFKLTLVLTLRQQQQQMKEKTHKDFNKLWYKTKKLSNLEPTSTIYLFIL